MLCLDIFAEHHLRQENDLLDILVYIDIYIAANIFEKISLIILNRVYIVILADFVKISFYPIFTSFNISISELFIKIFNLYTKDI